MNINLIADFPLDYMHLLYLGVMRRLLSQWLNGCPPYKISGHANEVISKRLESLRQYIPREFSRRPRGLAEMERWKATEFRQFLLYTGVVVLKDVLDDSMYHHFMLFSVASTCFINPSLCVDYCEYARHLMVLFINHAAKLYGPDFLVYNVHCLIHVADDVAKFGCLDRIGSFLYENFLGKLKHMVGNPNKPLEGVMRRLSEKRFLHANKKSNLQIHICKQLHKGDPLLYSPEYVINALQYKTLEISNCTLSIKSKKDGCIMVSGGGNAPTILVVENILCDKGHIVLCCRKFSNVIHAFEYPLLRDGDSSPWTRTRVGLESRSCWTRTRVLHIWTRTRDMRTRTRLGLGPSGLDRTRQTAQIRIDSRLLNH